jgi:hypothetical protein
MAFESTIERWILQRLNGEDVPVPSDMSDELRGRWERAHGVEPLLHDLDPLRKTALSLAFDIHVRELERVGAALQAAGLECVVLKGVPLALRLYEVPWARPSVDLDLLVLPDQATLVERELVALGWHTEGGARGRFFRERHFHTHLSASGRIPIELHHLAYRGFGSELTSAGLFQGKRAFGPGVYVPSPSRELVYLAVHAAGHRFNRIGWLLDLRLLFARLSPEDVAEAWAFARHTRFVGAFTAAMLLLRDHLDVRVKIPGPGRTALSSLATYVATEPENPILRSGSRLAFTLLLSDNARCRARYMRRALVDKVLLSGGESE